MKYLDHQNYQLSHLMYEEEWSRSVCDFMHAKQMHHILAYAASPCMHMPVTGRMKYRNKMHYDMPLWGEDGRWC